MTRRFQAQVIEFETDWQSEYYCDGDGAPEVGEVPVRIRYVARRGPTRDSRAVAEQDLVWLKRHDRRHKPFHDCEYQVVEVA